MRQALVVGHLSSSFVIRPHTQKKKKPNTCSVQRARTLLPTSSSSLSVSSSSSSSSCSDELDTGVNRLVPPIICEEEEENDMASNLRVEFCERQCKRLSESITINPTPSKKSLPGTYPSYFVHASSADYCCGCHS